MQGTYRVVTRGLKEGFSNEHVADLLATLFKRTREEIQPMLDAKGVVVKKGLDLPAATRYRQALEQCGCLSSIEPEIAAGIAPRSAPDAGAVASHADGLAAHAAGNYQQAFKIWTALAERGNATAQYSLASMYCDNGGLPRDFVEAHKWLSISRANGDKDAEPALKQVEGALSLVEIANARQRANAWMTIHRGTGTDSSEHAILRVAAERGNFSTGELETIIPRVRPLSFAGADARQPLAQGKPDSDAPAVYPLVGDLAVSYFFKGRSDEADLTHGTVDATCLTADELRMLAANNLHKRVYPVLKVQQMRLAPPGSQDPGDGTGFFHYIETGDGMEASCLLIGPLWDTFKSLVAGELRIVVPNQDMCMFCGTGDALTLRMMSDIGRDTKAESGMRGLSDQVLTVDPKGQLLVVRDGQGESQGPAPAATASDPGEISLSHARLRELQPELFMPEHWKNNPADRTGWIERIAEQLQSGDSRAAVVIDAGEGIVAAYADELDCVALLRFDPHTARSRGWQTGTRLLTVNMYSPKEHGVATDLAMGPRQLGTFGNFRPLIADLLTDDLARVNERKAEVPDDEWARAHQMGRQLYAENVVKPRDGRPLRCGSPAQKSR
jgi:hypothetical protein